MAATCWTPLRGQRIRVTIVDECGTPNAALTASSMATSSGFISVAYSPQYEDGDEFIQKNANGELCVNDRSCDVFKRYNVTITMCNVDPDLLGIITGAPAEVNVSGINVGFRTREGVACSNFALELWSGVPGQTCGVNEIQSVTEGGSGLTSFTLTYSGQTTSAIPAASTAATVQTALAALSNIGTGNVVVTGNTGGPYIVTFTGALAGTNVAAMTSTPTGGTGTVTVATIQGGGPTGSTYGYLLLPHVKNGTLRDFTIENGVTTFEIQGWTSGTSGWGSGPYNVVASGALGVPSALDDPILTGDHMLIRTTTVAPPAAVCGLQAMPATPTPAI